MLSAVVLALALPSTGALIPPEPQRYAVGFYVMPEGIKVGDAYNGATVVSVNHAIRAIAAVAATPALFEARTLLDPDVRYLEPDPWQDLLAFMPNDPRYPNMYGPQQIGAPAAWDRTLGTTSTVICVGDTGVRSTHEDLVGRFAGGFDFINNDNDPADDHGHGTHVTGTAAASTNNAKGIAGIAQASYKHAKVLNSAGSGTWTGVANGITWCADNGAHVISLSLGGSGGATVLEDAVNYAWNNGVVVVAAAGNSGPCASCVLFPAKYVNSIAVACTTSTKARCSFSSQGPEVDLAAPGSSIDSTCFNTDTSYCLKSGTSMSTPHVAGAAALLKSNSPALTNVEIRSDLESTAEDLGAAGPDNDFGHGLVRPDLAMADPQCSDGLDNDGDGLTDFPADPGCTSATDNDERDLTAPGAPGGLTATASKKQGGRITLSWTAPGDDGNSPITNYRVHRGTCSGCEAFYAQVGNVLTYTDTEVDRRVTYYYTVSAVNAVGEGPLSNEASAAV